jgi:agmatine/peptidylarginine deiminase
MTKFKFSLVILLIPMNMLFAQDNKDLPEKLTHWLTPNEMLRLHEIGLGFVETDPPAAPVRNLAEFDRMQGALIRYPFGIPMTVIKEMAEDVMLTTIVANAGQQNTVLQLYINNGVDTSHCNFLIAGTNSYWTRDYGPWFVSYHTDSVGIVDFPYNRPRPLDDEIPKLVAGMLGIPWFGMKLVHTGGNYMTDGLGMSASTELVWEENPTLTHEQIAQKVHDYLGIDTYHVRPDPNGTYIDHIDCWAKYLAPDKILVRKVPSYHPRYAQIEAAAAYWAATPCPYGYNYKVYRVNTPNDQPYTNSLILNEKVLLPFVNSTWDDSARAVYQSAMPGYEVLGFLGQPSAPWESTDALHCRVMGMGDIGILYIRHIPITGNQPCEEDYTINADIIACSRLPLKQDSLFIYYRVDNGAYQVSPLFHVTGIQYTGTIPRQPAGSTIQYFLFAADESPRRETCPFMGSADPFEFHTIYTDITAIPDTVWFLTYEDCLFGKPLTIHNFTDTVRTVTGIDYWGDFWYVKDAPVVSLPYNLVPGDSIPMTILVNLPVGSHLMTFMIDTMYITSSIRTYPIIIMINDSLFTGIKPSTIPAGVISVASYPNPFRETTRITYRLPCSGNISLQVFDIHGTLIRTLKEGYSELTGSTEWDGCSELGMAMPSGVYYYRLCLNGQMATNRMILIR